MLLVIINKYNLKTIEVKVSFLLVFLILDPFFLL